MNNFADKFSMKKLDVKNLADGTTFTTAKIIKNKKKKITISDIQKLSDNLYDKAEQQNKPMKLMIRALGSDGWKTLKGMHEDEMMSQDEYDDYFRNKVEDVSKFNKFHQLQFYVIK